MKKIGLFLSATFLLNAGLAWAEPATAAPEPAALTLQKAYELALKKSETIGQQAELIQEAQGHFYQAMNVLMPSVEFVMTRFEQDANPPEFSGSATDGASSNGTRRVTPLNKFTFHQPIFSGFKEFSALGASNAEKAQRRHELRRAQELLMVDVADSFYTLVQARRDLEVLDAIHKLMNERIGDLKEREGLGRSRTSEVQSAISELKQVEADRIEAERFEKVAQDLLEFYTGEPVIGALDEGTESMYLQENQQLEYYMAGYDKRSDVLAASEAYRISEKAMRIAQAGFLPSVALDANLYTKRVGFQKDIDWDTTFTVSVPIFDGMQTIGDVKVAAAQRQSAKLELSRVRRMAQREIQDAYETFYSSVRSDAALQQAAEASEQNYKLQTEDYSTNLVNNLEVLDALRRYEEINRRYNTARYDMFKNYWRLKVASGQDIQS